MQMEQSCGMLLIQVHTMVLAFPEETLPRLQVFQTSHLRKDVVKSILCIKFLRFMTTTFFYNENFQIYGICDRICEKGP